MEFHISDYRARRVHFIGICGVSMNALAQALLSRGCTVTGSDRSDGPMAERLRAAGIPVAIGHAAENVHGADAVVRNAAIADSSPDICEARRLGIPVFERPEVLGAIMREHERCVCVAGTHGKSTVSSMLSAITLAAGLDPSIFIGASYAPIGGTYRLGASDVMVAEACEYCDSFLSFWPRIALVLNIEADHLDYFSGIEAIRDSFTRFALRTPKDGLVIYNADDPNCRLALDGIDRECLRFGLSEDADVQARDVTYSRGCARFELVYRGRSLCRIENGVPGDFNLFNALAAAAAAISLGIPPEVCAAALRDFCGAGRRMEYKGELCGARVFDDYAHHPSELRATLRTARTMTEGRIICAFQPHTYTRTRALRADFIDALRLCDLCLIPPIYAARERDDGSISSADLAAGVPGALAPESLEACARIIRGHVRPGDLVLTVGAGDVTGLWDLLRR